MSKQPTVRAIGKHEPIFSLPPYKVEQVLLAAAETIDWGLEILSIPTLWRQTKGKDITVAILDTGMDFSHPDIKDAVIDAKDFTKSHSGAYDNAGHGTHVAGIIAARQNSSGVVGVAPLAKLLIGKVLGDNGYGSSESVVNGIKWAIEKKTNIISMSLGSQYPDERIHQAIKDAVKQGIFVICAAGNDGPSLDTINYPGAFDETVAVGSIDRRRNISSFSSRGKQVDIVAPGDDIFSTYPPKNYAKLSGTSMATPFVSGVVALMLSKHKEFGGKTPIKNQADLLQHLSATAIDAGPHGFDPAYGFGIINPEKLLMSQSKKLLNLVAAQDLTPSGLKKMAEFTNNKQIKPTVSGEAYLEGSIRSGGQGEIKGGIKISL